MLKAVLLVICIVFALAGVLVVWLGSKTTTNSWIMSAVLGLVLVSAGGLIGSIVSQL